MVLKMIDRFFIRWCVVLTVIVYITSSDAQAKIRNRLPGAISAEVLPSIVAIRAETSQIYRDKPSAVMVPKKGIVILQRFKAARASKAGMGVIVTDDGLIVTNEHTVSGVNDVSVIMYDGREFSGKVVWRFAKEDFALISITSKEKLKPIRFSDPNSVKGARRVFAIVAKVAKDEIVMAALPGKIVSVTKNVFWPETKTVFAEVVETDIHLYYGASGGPLITPGGHLVGVVESGYLLKNKSFAISSNRINALVRTYLKKKNTQAAR